MYHLPPSTVRLIGSTQVITSIYSVIKELVENSIDAGATTVDVKLEGHGLDKIEVRDNGSGIKSSDIPFVGQRYYTSKIQSHEDLEKLMTYGFRGEALGSLCSVSEVHITTKTEDDEVGMTYTLDHHGQITGKKPSHFGQGTTITAENLFKNLPVRKQFYNTNKKKKEELKKIEDTLTEFGIIRPEIRFTFRHGKELVWQKNVLPDVKSVLLTFLGRNTFSQLEYKLLCSADPEYKIEIYLPVGHSDIQQTSRASKDRGYSYVNKRPVLIKEIEKLMKEYYQRSHQCESVRYPVYVISITVLNSEVDINLDPNKERVMLHAKEEIVASLHEFLKDFYASSISKTSNNAGQTKNKVSAKDEVVPNRKTNEPCDIISADALHTNGQKSVTDKQLSSTSGEQTEIALSDMNSVSGAGSQSERNHVSEYPPNAQSQMDAVGNFDIDFLDSNIPSDALNSQLQLKSDQSTLNNNINLQNNTEIIRTVTPDSERIVIDEDVMDELLSTFPDSSHSATEISIPSTEQKDLAEGQMKNISSTDGSRNEPSLPYREGREENSSFGCSEWSKGCALIGSDGQSVQPVTLLPPDEHLTPGKRPPSPSHNKTFLANNAPPKKRMSVESGQSTMYDLIGCQPVKRPDSPFTLFSKNNRQQVVEDNPDSNFEEVSKTIADLWERLPEDEKEIYKAQSSSKQMKYQEQIQKANGRPVPAMSKKKLSKLSIRDRLLEAPNSQKQKTPIKNKRVSIIKFSLHTLQSHQSWIRSSQKKENPKLHLIGPLKSCRCWVFDSKDKISLLNTHRVEEVVLFEQLMRSHCVPTEKLVKPCMLTERTVGSPELWKVLRRLVPETWNEGAYCNIIDPRIIKNGFEIKCFKDESTQDFGAEIYAKAKDIPTYGTQDLAQILQSINDGSTRLCSTRPTKVLHYLKSEAVRMSRQLQAQKTKEDIEQLMSQLEKLSPSQKDTCLHNKPFYHQLFNLNDIPLSQDESISQSQ